MSALLLALILVANQDPSIVRVTTRAEFQMALRDAKPGTKIIVARGTYKGGLFAENIHGTKERPIVISTTEGAEIEGGVNGLHLSRVSHIRIENLSVFGATGNGINIDDGGDRKRLSSNISIVGVTVSDLPTGNHDGIKLSGVRDFEIDEVRVHKWGGSAIDMVGCHRGFIRRSSFESGGDNGVQVKGGSSDIVVERCRFYSSGQRGVNFGGSTGFEFFRPPLEEMVSGKRYEARNIVVRGCQFYAATAAAAFVGVDGAQFEYNTIHAPTRWAFRILQETRDPSFVPSRGGVIARNLILFSSQAWSEGGVNVGPGTDPASFRFERNYWYCSDRPEVSRPKLPTPEIDGVYGVDPEYQSGRGGL
ncbi:MAG TPA: right-handed parallel beta-helix repeat-containing protein, partial [Fimbriimonadaceae bacterium]|nr:right-handed parallel beta-helix repeat-containing protein [Fimbriimonadaceae bacterium]